jgi:electron transfer flavoprotein beta subunit
MMRPRIVVAVKQVRVVTDELDDILEVSDLAGADLVRAMNEWDAFAVEEALQIRERLGQGEVVVVTVGDGDANAVLRRCLAMGADRAIRIDATCIDSLSTARALAGTIAAEAPNLVLFGAQSSDSVQGATGPAVAGLLGLPVSAVVTRVIWNGTGPALVHRELEEGLIDVVDIDTPAVLTIQSGINEPRYVNLRAIKQAEQQEIRVHEHVDVGAPAFRMSRMFAPPRAEGAEMLAGGPAEIAQQIAELVRERLA